MNVSLTYPTLARHNRKVGMIPVSTTSAVSCPTSCPLSKGGCYAKGGPLAIVWKRVTEGVNGTSYETFLERVAQMQPGQLWRHNQAGDLPGTGDAIDGAMLRDLVRANVGRRGFTYTHKPMTRVNAELVSRANAGGFTINLSADNIEEADQLADLGVAPVVVVLPRDQTTNTKTPAGRTVVICPATNREGVSCATCGLCQRKDRPSIVGFPAHGSSIKKASAIAEEGFNPRLIG